jgi:site-specific recombinase XerD
MTVNYHKKNPNDKISPVICILSDGRNYRVKLYTGLKVARLTTGKNKNKDTGDAAVNLELYGPNNYGERIKKIYIEAKKIGILPDRQYFVERLKAKPVEKISGFWNLWEQFVQTGKLYRFKPATVKKYTSLKNHLKDFEKTGQKLDLETIGESILEDFQAFCYTKEPKPLNTGTTAKYIGLLKMFLNWCHKKGHMGNTFWRYFSPIRQPDGLKVIMSDQDIDSITKVDLKEKNHLRNVRALFILSCETGLRFSDYTRINSQHLKQDGDGYNLEIRQTKTDEHVSIPLTETALNTVRELINGKYHAITNQRMNEYVKNLCELAEITEPFEVHKYKGRDKTVEIIPKHKLVTTHTGRRTFATNLLNKGVPAEVVMKFTGHKDYRSFAKYVNIPRRAATEMVRQALEGKKTNDKNMWVA